MPTINDRYRVQHGCHSCRYVFVKREYDEGDTYYCSKDAPPRPICGSIFMDESFTSAREGLDITAGDRYTDKDPFSVALYEWERWSDGREVSCHGICDRHEAMHDK
jgi:hypothetical protein